MSRADALHNSRMLRAVRREPTDTTPVWIMRQAGRYLPEYRAVREGHDFLDFCKNPELSAQVTLEAQAILGVDAAILFADLPTILEPMGFGLSYDPGPQIANPLRTAEDLARVEVMRDPSPMHFVYETVEKVRAGLPDDIPLIGFGGSPFTLASYAIEGAGSRNYVHTKTLMYTDPAAWHDFCGRLVESLLVYLKQQIETGCQIIQLFDSWAGCLSPADYREYVLPHTKAVIDGIGDAAPVINFATGNPALLPLLREAGGDVIGIDWRIDLGEAWDIVGYDKAVQGNLEPITLFADLETIEKRTREVLASAGGRPGHIFNLGHGVLPGMNPDHVKALVRMVHEFGATTDS